MRTGIYAAAIAISLLLPSAAQARPERTLPRPIRAKLEVRISLHEIGVRSIKWVHCDHRKGRPDVFCATRYAYPRNQKPWISCTIIRDCDPARVMADGITFQVHCREHLHVYYSTNAGPVDIELGPGLEWGEDYWTVTESTDPPRCWMSYQPG